MKAQGYIKSVHPVLPVQDVQQAIRFCVAKLGFKLSFQDQPKNPFYAGVTRDGIELHLQRHDSKEWESITHRPMLRFVCDAIEQLYNEYEAKGIFHANTSLKITSWNTREFAFYDLYKNGLTFYEDL
ncbi:VOC family protein [Ascidiimonas sp. W6]|uniref:VOC family protein n=1 Tax=Ascidiimonas meishanensis TaxID=3128903 RepID=UPI0030EDB04C